MRRIKLHRLTIFLFILFLYSGCSEQTAFTPLSTEAVILAFGDSLTYGIGAEPGQSYPSQLERLTGLKVVNAGVPGEVTEQGRQRLPAMLDQSAPELLILCHGGNDILRRKSMEDMRNNIRAMIREARERGVQILLVGVPEPGIFLDAADIYEEIAQQDDVMIEADALPDLLGERDLKSDLIHLNGEGYRRFAEALLEKLQQGRAL